MTEIQIWNLGPGDLNDEGPDVLIARCPKCGRGFASEDRRDARDAAKEHLREKH